MLYPSKKIKEILRNPNPIRLMQMKNRSNQMKKMKY